MANPDLSENIVNGKFVIYSCYDRVEGLFVDSKNLVDDGQVITKKSAPLESLTTVSLASSTSLLRVNTLEYLVEAHSAGQRLDAAKRSRCIGGLRQQCERNRLLPGL